VLPRFVVSNLVALAGNEAVIAGLDHLYGHARHGAATLNLIEAAAVGGALVVNYVLSSRWVFRAATGTPERLGAR
jgi:putative flippase GtrA